MAALLQIKEPWQASAVRRNCLENKFETERNEKQIGNKCRNNKPDKLIWLLWVFPIVELLICFTIHFPNEDIREKNGFFFSFHVGLNKVKELSPQSVDMEISRGSIKVTTSFSSYISFCLNEKIKNLILPGGWMNFADPVTNWLYIWLGSAGRILNGCTEYPTRRHRTKCSLTIWRCNDKRWLAQRCGNSIHITHFSLISISTDAAV